MTSYYLDGSVYSKCIFLKIIQKFSFFLIYVFMFIVLVYILFYFYKNMFIDCSDFELDMSELDTIKKSLSLITVQGIGFINNDKLKKYSKNVFVNSG